MRPLGWRDLREMWKERMPIGLWLEELLQQMSLPCTKFMNQWDDDEEEEEEEEEEVCY